MLLVLAGSLVVGVLVGAGLRVALARAARGTRVGPGPCEVAMVLVWLPVALGLATGSVSLRGAALWLGAGLLAVAGSVTDVVDHRLPDVLTLPALPAALALVVPRGPDALVRASVGAVLFLAVHAAVAVAMPWTLGGGDVKLAPSLGAVLGASSWSALVVGPVLAAAGVLVLAAAVRRRAVPFGPPALVAAWVVVAVTTLTAGRPP